LHAHVSQVELYRANPDLLALDCTYKTNRYNMPLLYFLGVSLIGKYFSATFCFLSSEKADDYNWALLQFVERVLPLDSSNPNDFYLTPNVIITNNETGLKNALAY
jgi:hypothetical protein